MKKLLNILTGLLLSTTAGFTTIACSNNSSSNGQLTSTLLATLNSDCTPNMLFVDNNNTLYISAANSTTQKGEIYKISNNKAELFVGITPDSSAWQLPQNTVVDQKNNLYTYFLGTQKIYKIAPSGAITTFDLSTKNQIIDAMVCDKAGNVFISTHDDNKANKILEIAHDSTTEPTEYIALTNNAVKMIIDNDDNIFYAAESNTENPIDTTIYKITAPSDASLQPTISSYIDVGNDKRIFMMILDSNGNIYTSSTQTSDINKISPNADKTTGTSELFVNLNMQASNLVFDSKDNLYVSSATDSKIYQITPNKQKSTYINLVNDYPYFLTIDSKDTLYAANMTSRKIYRIGY